MPVVDVDPDELRRLTGHTEKSDDELKADLFALGLEYEGTTEDGEFQLEFAPDRLDRLSIEGVARSLRYQYGDARGVSIPSANDPDWTIAVEESVPDERPYVTGAIVRGLDLDERTLDSIIQLQEKLHATMGRKRAKGAIGIHDLTMLKGAAAVDGNTILYRGVEPEGDRFVPLDSDEELTPAAVLERHRTGREYADLVADYDRYPAIYDEIGLFSFPPVINGRRTEVTTDSRDLFIEMTGTDQWTIDKMCVIVCYALAARGGRVESVRVEYPEGEPYDRPDLLRPDLSTKTKRVTHDRIERLVGVDLDADEVVDLFERSGLDAEIKTVGDDELAYDVTVPPYRVDVLHPVDLVDDAGRALGFNDLVPRYPDVSTVGGRTGESRLEEAVRDTLVGLGFQDLLNFHLVAEDENYWRMMREYGRDASDLVETEGPDESAADHARDDGVAFEELFALDEMLEALPDVYGTRPLGFGRPATIVEPYSEEYELLRTWALPSLLMVLENNTHRAYPQDLAEVGLVAVRDESENTGVAEWRSVAGVLARHDASYEDAKARLQALARSFDVDLETPPTGHPSFIPGRTAAVVLDGESVGVVGEFAPGVLVKHDLEVPVVGFEFRLDALS